MSTVIAVTLVLAVLSRGDQDPRLPALQSVRVDAATTSSPSVVIEATGPLPQPRVGVLEGPPRIYLDFQGVTPAPGVTLPPAEGLVRRVRVALNNLDPVVTRVVIDLARTTAHRVDASGRERGRVAVVLIDAPGMRARALAPPEQPDAFVELGRLRPLLSSIDSRTDVPEDSLRAAIVAFDAIQQKLSRLRTDWTRDLQIKVCVLGRTAAATRLDAQQRGDAAAAWNAAAAAAGALLLLERTASTPKTAPHRRSRRDSSRLRRLGRFYRPRDAVR